jgi:DNA invertase Pin-like site-specific DNA recombinase
MKNNKVFCSYRRVSTKFQLSENSHSLDAQKAICERYAASQDGSLVADFVEQESGKVNDRIELRKALDFCKKNRAILLISRLDRLSRSASFLIQLQDSGVDFVACDMPSANKLTISLMAVIAQNERETTSMRVKEALAHVKSEGKVKLGSPCPDKTVPLMVEGNKRAKTEFASRMAAIVAEIRSSGVSTLQGMADCLNRRGYASRTGKQWFPSTVRNLLAAIPQ